MDFLSMLLGQQAAGTLRGSTFNSENPEDNEILAAASPIPQTTEPVGPSAEEIDQYAGMNLDNSEAVLANNRARASTEAAADRKGMFGTKGALRDILGVVGDAFLVQSGNDAIYGPKRDQERMSDALAGMTANERAAIERAGALNPAFGKQMLDDYLVRQQGDTENMIRAQTATTTQDKANFEIMNDVRDRAARLLAGARTPEERAYAIQQIQTLAGEAKQSMEAIGVSPDMTEEQAQLYSRQDMRVNQQEMLPRRDRALDQAEYRNQTGRISATRPRATPNPTEATELVRIRDRVNRRQPLSPGDAATWKRYQEGTGGGGSLLDRVPPPPGATSNTGRFGPRRN